MKNGLLTGEFVKHYLNGKVSEKGYYKYGFLDSNYMCYFANGKEHFWGKHRFGEKEGKWTYNNLENKIEIYENLKNGEDEGAFVRYVNGSVRYLSNYTHGDKDSAQVVYGEDNKIAGILYFETGDLMGYTYEGKDGQLLPMIPVVNGTAQINTFYANGNKALEWNYINSQLDGKQLIYYSNGNLAEERTLGNQYLQGLYKRCYPNGKTAYEVKYEDDEEQGPATTYDANGNVLAKENFYWGNLHGLVQIKESTSKKFINIVYRYGKQKELK